MFKAIYRAGVILITLVAFVYFHFTQTAVAQIAPTSSAAISGSVSDSSGKPVATANVTLSGPKSAATQTDAHGLFVFVGMPFGTYKLSVAAQGLGTVTRSVTVEGDTNIAIQYQPLTGNLKIIANVSSSANALFNVTPASVTQVSPLTNAFEGKTSWRTILEQIPGVAQAGLGDGGYQTASLPDGPLMPVKLSINGALPYETATLLDDMPIIGTSASSGIAGTGTDLGLYPLNGFGAADVVRGPGASAPSIVDSIGGSFVLHAPGMVTQNHYDFSLSTDPYGGIVANALAAVRWKNLSVIVTYGINDSPGPTNAATIPAFTLFSPSTVNGMPFSCTGLCVTTPAFNPNYNVNGYPLYGFTTGLLTCCYQASTAWSQHSGSAAFTYQFSPSLTAKVFYVGQLSQQSAPYPVCTDIFTPPSGYTGNIPAGQLQLSTQGYLLTSFPFQETSSLLEESLVKQIGQGFLRFAALQNRTSVTYTLSTPNSATVQLFGSGTVGGTPTVFNGDTYNVTYPSVSEYVSQGSSNRDILLSYTTPLGENVRAGASFVRSYYDIPCQVMYDGFELFSLPSAVSQTTNEFRFFVGGTPSAKTSVDLSMYFANADYHVQNPNDFTGNTYVDERYSYAAPRLGFVWRPTAAISVRASAGGGFAEAPLGDLTGSNGAITPGPGYYTVTLTSLNLQPEKSFGFDLGTDIQLRRNTVLSFDVYRTNLYGQLYYSTSATGTYLGLPLYTTQYGNLGESRYEGVLLDLRHDTPHGVYWALSGGLTRGYLISVPGGAAFYDSIDYPPPTYTPTVCTYCANLTVVPNVNFNGTFTAGASIPYAQGLGTFGYRWNPEKYIDLVGTYYGNNNTYFRPAFVELDGHVSYPLGKNASLLVTFRNITGIYDGATQLRSATNFVGTPTISGLPYPEIGEEYGPRTVLLTMQLHI